MLQNLQDAGEDEYKAERAFYHYMGDLQKTKDHLAAAKQVIWILKIYFILVVLDQYLGKRNKVKYGWV